MDTPDSTDKPAWDNWRTEQVRTITQILTNVFKVEDEARQMKAPSRLLRRSSIDSPEAEAEVRQKLNQIRQQISEYEEMLKLGMQRVNKALEKIEPVSLQKPPETPKRQTLIQKLKLFFFRQSVK